MFEDQTAKSKLSAVYAQKRREGLLSARFIVDGDSLEDVAGNVRHLEAQEEVAREVLRLEAALERGEFRELRFNDKRYR
jgi:2-phospho-L-lactate guanylyltransferase (CobY/MobA/RfbA family)